MTITVSLKEALRERPGRPQQALISNAPSQRRELWREEATPCTKPTDLQPGERGTYTVAALWTAAEFRTYRHLLDRSMSSVITEAATGKVWLRRFEEKHGKEICSMMLAEVRRQDESEWFKSKKQGGGKK